MIEAPVLLVLTLFMPIITASFANAFGEIKWLRNASLIAPSSLTIYFCYLLSAQETAEANLFEIIPDINFAFKVEPLGLVFAGVASVLWLATIIYSIGYLEKTHDKHQTRFFVLLSVSISFVLGLCFAENLLVMLIFYELITISTLPLVMHKHNEETQKAGAKYLAYLMGSSLALLTPAVAITYYLTGSLSFAKGGLSFDTMPDWQKILLLLAFVYGFAKAALMPFHKWLPEAMVAPTPVSALLHAVAVVKAGVFCIAKVIVLVFGFNFVSPQILQYLAAISLITASIIAITKTNLKARLAYSTISQLSYIILACSIFSSAGISSAMLQLASHSFAKITLFFVAGIVISCAGASDIKSLSGLGRKFPLAFICFTVASLSLIGVSGLAGYYSKHAIIEAMQSANMIWSVWVLYIGAALAAVYLLQIPFVAFSGKSDSNTTKPPFAMNVAIIITAALTAGFGLFYGEILDILRVL